MVSIDGTLPLPWIEPALRQCLRSNAHALLLHGPQGVGQFELALTVAQAWLCEASTATAAATSKPCGVCASCRLVQAHSHPDLMVLLPEVAQEALGWKSADSDEGAVDRASKAKPSKDIKVDAVRGAVNFAQTTSGRGRAKVVVLHPAERMNGISANTLLKTLEEPAGQARFVLSCAAPDALLPTIRSRCQSVAMKLPSTAQAIEWLVSHGVPEAAVMLAAAGGQPQEALDWHLQGVDAALWTRLPGLIRRGESAVLAGWPLPRLVDALQKVCHDAACIAAGAAPRYFPASAIGRATQGDGLSDWMRELARVARHAEHPWNVGLMAETLVEQGRAALDSASQKGASARGISVHSRG